MKALQESSVKTAQAEVRYIGYSDAVNVVRVWGMVYAYY